MLTKYQPFAQPPEPEHLGTDCATFTNLSSQFKVDLSLLFFLYFSWSSSLRISKNRAKDFVKLMKAMDIPVKDKDYFPSASITR